MIFVRHFLVAALCAAATACAPTTAPPSTGTVQEQAASLWVADTRTVLTGDAALGLTQQCSRISPGPVESVWTPTPAQLDALEDELILFLSRQLEAAGIGRSPGDYYRQYAGFVVGGRQIIYVNGVGASAIDVEPIPYHPFDWHTQATQICDGGPITFGVEYDVATHSFANFSFNGDAGGPFPPRR
jgi:hypothetical protein